MITINDIKKYIVCLNGGTGVVFQPMDVSYSYILTAKHVFKDITEAVYGNMVHLYYYDPTASSFTLLTPFALREGVNYFPHELEEVDIAILKIQRLSVPDDMVIEDDIFSRPKDHLLIGFPSLRRKGAISINWIRTDIDVEILVDRLHQKVEADIMKNQTRAELMGSSGGGIFKITNGQLWLAGIQSGVVNDVETLGRIEFTPISKFGDIINNSKKELEDILPAYMKCFSFLEEEAFQLKVDIFNKKDIESVRNYLKNKITDVIQCGITPLAIKTFFETRLLVNKTESDILYVKNIWLAWLEFLTVLNLIKYKSFGENELSEIFNNYRLIYSNNSGDWTELLKNELQYADYKGLKDDSLIFIGTSTEPLRTRKVPPGKLRMDIARVFDKKRFQTDGGFDPYQKFTFVHVSYLQQECIIEKLESYQNKNAEELIIELKNQYNELFRL